MDVAPKTVAAVGAGSFSIALVEIAQWILSYRNITIPPGVGAAFATVFSGIGAYYAPHSHVAQPQPEQYNPTTPL